MAVAGTGSTAAVGSSVLGSTTGSKTGQQRILLGIVLIRRILIVKKTRITTMRCQTYQLGLELVQRPLQRLERQQLEQQQQREQSPLALEWWSQSQQAWLPSLKASVSS